MSEDSEKIFQFCFKRLAFVGVQLKKNNVKPIVILNYLVMFVLLSLTLTNIYFKFDMMYIETVFLDVQGAAKYGILIINKQKFCKLLDLSRDFWKVDHSDSRNKILKIYLNCEKYLVYILLVFITLCGLKPFYVKNGTILDCYVPKGFPSLLIYIMEYYLLLVGCALYTGVTALICIMIVSPIVQFRILNDKLKGLKFDNINNDNDLQNCMNKLKKYSAYHDFLLSYIKHLNEAVSMPITLLLLFNGALLCMGMFNMTFELSYLQKVRSVMICSMMTIEFFVVYGFPTQLLMDEAEAVGDSLYYHTSWYSPNVIIPIKKFMLMFMVRSQYPTGISAEGFVDINNRTVVSILKMVYSFYTLLQTMN